MSGDDFIVNWLDKDGLVGFGSSTGSLIPRLGLGISVFESGMDETSFGIVGRLAAGCAGCLGIAVEPFENSGSGFIFKLVDVFWRENEALAELLSVSGNLNAPILRSSFLPWNAALLTSGRFVKRASGLS